MTRLTSKVTERGENAANLALKVGLPASRVEEILAGAPPLMSELRVLAKALKASVSDLLEPQNAEVPQATRIRFRSTNKALSPEKTSLAQSLERRTEEIATVLRGPDWNSHWGSRKGALPPIIENMGGAEAAANAFRLGVLKVDLARPLLDFPALLDSLGFLIFVIGGLRIDGASALVDGHPFVIISPRFNGRMLFTLAHEVGHFVAHHVTDGAALFDEEDAIGSSSNSSIAGESFADAFASAILMPKAGIGRTLQEIRERAGTVMSEELGDVEIIALSHAFGVSFQAAAFRCESLGLIPRGGANSLYEHIKKKHGSPEVRASEVGLPPRKLVVFPTAPTVALQRGASQIVNGSLSIGAVSRALGVAQQEIMNVGDTLS